MKLFKIYTCTLSSLLAGEADPLAQKLANAINSHNAFRDLSDDSHVEEYIAYDLGNILTDEGLAVDQSETLSLDDGHVLYGEDDIDLAYFHDQMVGYQFGTFYRVSDGIVTILHYAK
jgi:hypothetical protein